MAKDSSPAAPRAGGNVEELRYMQQLYQNQYSIIGNSMNVALRELQELNSAQKTLESMETVSGKETLTSIGGDFYVTSMVADPNKVIVGVGAGVLVEKNIDDAKLYVSELIKRSTDNINSLTKGRKDVENALFEISYRLENIR